MFGLVPWRKEQSTELDQRDDPFHVMRQELNSVFDRVFGSLTAEGALVGWGLNVEDDGKVVVVRAEAPGFEAGDFDVQVVGDELFVRAEHKEEGTEAEVRRYGLFERRVSLPAGTDVGKVEALYRNGVLEVRLPRTPEAVGRKIEVKG